MAETPDRPGGRRHHRRRRAPRARARSAPAHHPGGVARPRPGGVRRPPTTSCPRSCGSCPTTTIRTAARPTPAASVFQRYVARRHGPPRLRLHARALVAAVLVGLTAPAVGVFLVQRRLTLIGDGLGHVAVAGVALGLVLDRSPVAFALAAVTVGAAVVVELLRLKGGASGRDRPRLRVLRRHRRRRGAGQPGAVGVAQPQRLPVRRHHHDVDRRPGRLRACSARRGAGPGRRCSAGSCSRQQRRGVRQGRPACRS